MSLIYSEDAESKVMEIRLDGRVTRADFDAIADKVQAFIDAYQPVRMVEIIDSFEGFDPSVLWPGIKFDIRNIRHISHVAVVSDLGWISPLSKAAGAVISTRLRTFDMAHLDEARDWVRSADTDQG